MTKHTDTSRSGDLVKMLRAGDLCGLTLAADRIEALEAENERLKTENEAAGRNVAMLQRDGVKFCEALRKCADLVRRYNGRQSEKLDDIPSIVAAALGEKQ